MSINDLSEWRLNKVENILNTVEENLLQMQRNFDLLLDNSMRLSDRIKSLEVEQRDKKLKKYIFSLMLWFYPLVIGFLVLALNVDHDRLMSTANDIDNLLQVAQQTLEMIK